MIEIINKEEKHRLVDHLKDRMPPPGYTPDSPLWISKLHDLLSFIDTYRCAIETQLSTVDSYVDLGTETTEAIAVLERCYWALYIILSKWAYINKAQPMPIMVNAAKEYKKLYTDKILNAFNLEENYRISRKLHCDERELAAMRNDLLLNKYRCSRYQFVAHMALYKFEVKTFTGGNIRALIRLNLELGGELDTSVYNLTKLAPAAIAVNFSAVKYR